MKISIIVTTYNRPDALQIILEAFAYQTDKNFEVIIADDGSRDDTRTMIERLKEKIPYSIKHVWQPDNGFQAAQIRNKGIVAAEGDYIIFIDGDCIPRKNFVAQHRKLAERGWFVAGNRVLISEAYTKILLDEQTATLKLNHFLMLLKLSLSKKINRFSSTLILNLGYFRKRYPQKWKGVKTCNLGVWKKDLLTVNGFDESYQGWGYEDSDLAIRLLHAGIRAKSGRFATTIFHLWHRENDRSQEADNLSRLYEVERSEVIIAAKGLDQY